ncbi:MAG TPA: carboxypeptidase regulatory-like domain-containing protein [Longimicrobiales bacterium]|nr:carboxypeptidase regulatory-like domain-containing protein [Longimicrobiales bacterium]
MRCPRPRLASLAVSALALLAGPLVAPAAAQTIVGAVTDRGTAAPLAGAFIVLLDEQDRRLNGVLSGADGAYVLRAAAPGRYRLRAEMIGYATTTTGWIDLAAGASMRQDLSAAVEAVSLEAIQVETGGRCRRRPGSGPETARLWEEARKALEVARWGEGQGVLRFEVVEHRRELDATNLRVVAQKEESKRGLYDRSPYRSIPASRLAGGGYVQLATDERWDFFAPDAEVLLSESFLESHCFSVAGAPPGEPGLIGLAFEPVPERTLPDIRGALWLDRGSAELQRLDYRYVALPFRHGRWDQVGGRVEFERLATGMWIVRRWYIRMPLAAQETGGFGGAPRELELLTLSEEGAEVRAVMTREGTRVAEAIGATLFGTVTGSEGGLGPGLADATVEVVAAGARTTTADDGGFRLTGLPSGTYGIRITHPELVRTGVGPLERIVELNAGRATRLVVGANLTSARAREVCEEGGWAPAGRGGDPALVYGVVLGPDGETPVPGALLRVWVGGPELRVLADSTGAFRFCLDPATEPVRVAAVEPSAVLASPGLLDVVRVDASRPGFVSARVPLSRARAVAAGARAAGASWSNAILGRVLEEGTSRPVEGALVTLTTPDGAVAGSMVTDETGRFKLLHPSGSGDRFTLRVDHVAYGTVASAVRFPPRQELRMDVLVSTRAIDLDPIVVTERRHDFLADQGFYDRLERAAGVFIQREEIERRRPTRITDLLQGRTGLQVVSSGGDYDIRLMQQISFRTDAMRCRPSIWVDGVMIRSGGEPRGETALGTGLMLSEVIDPEHVEAMEVYTGPAGMPQAFGGTYSPCGAVVIWTRRGGAPTP